MQREKLNLKFHNFYIINVAHGSKVPCTNDDSDGSIKQIKFSSLKKFSEYIEKVQAATEVRNFH